MAKKMTRLVLLFSLLWLLTACDSPETHLAVLQGNYAFARGEYHEATFKYLQALDFDRWKNRVHYNLGNVYHELGEDDAALQEWELASSDQDKELSFRIAFNQGVLFFGQGHYQEAYDAFRRALIFHPASVDAKINLEHALRKISRKRQEQQTESPQAALPEAKGESERILDYVRRSESFTWSSAPEADHDKGAQQW
ncbi:tetratricopeptide repeat protein [Sediminispirochaeta bajacaliforniensis]|uniref:tetratricopeptide repeat protein n=1 Tax=Sediminispirochaeta bajacaliforniensis TaxID=148 RepID=UPI00036B6393|nr:tetratricopeptide repeat protein [Sediminispirochaeta bajacaliforniensis]